MARKTEIMLGILTERGVIFKITVLHNYFKAKEGKHSINQSESRRIPINLHQWPMLHTALPKDTENLWQNPQAAICRCPAGPGEQWLLSLLHFQIFLKCLPLAEFKANPYWPGNLVNVAFKLSVPCYMLEFKRIGIVIYIYKISRHSLLFDSSYISIYQ